MFDYVIKPMVHEVNIKPNEKPFLAFAKNMKTSASMSSLNWWNSMPKFCEVLVPIIFYEWGERKAILVWGW